MEEPGIKDEANKDDHDHFYDAFDDFPFYDCSDAFEPEPSVSHSTISHLEPNTSQTASSLRRRSSTHHRLGISSTDAKDTSPASEISQVQDGKTTISRERKYKMYRNLQQNEGECEKPESSGAEASSGQNFEDSATRTAKDVQADGSGSRSLLVFFAELVIKAIGFQVNLFISFFTFPVWLTYNICAFAIDPFQRMRLGREYLRGKVLRLWAAACESVNPFISEWMKEHKSMWQLVFRFGWGLLLSIYVGFILCGLLITAFIASGFVMRNLVEEPIRLEEPLNFDYTKNSPVAFVPIKSCPTTACVYCEENIEARKHGDLHVIPPNHRLRVTILLTLPESEYNRNLGVFQVRLDFLSAKYRGLASSSRPCMLQFKSLPIHLLLTFFKMAPLVAGYLSESQTLNVNFRGFTEGDEPTACLKVTIEQRAEYRPGAGIPEIYAASLILESELPLVKRIIWYWKKTIFIWLGMTVFIMELMFALVCCRPIIIPRARPRNGSTSSPATATQNNMSVQS